MSRPAWLSGPRTRTPGSRDRWAVPERSRVPLRAARARRGSRQCARDGLPGAPRRPPARLRPARRTDPRRSARRGARRRPACGGSRAARLCDVGRCRPRPASPTRRACWAWRVRQAARQAPRAPARAGGSAGSRGASRGQATIVAASATSAAARATLPQRMRARSGVWRSGSTPAIGLRGVGIRPPVAIMRRRMPAADPLYDLVLMLDSAAPDEQRAKVLTSVEQIIGPVGIVNTQDWGVRQTAYEIGHKTDAEYHLLQFHGVREVLESLQRVLRITDGVIRFASSSSSPARRRRRRRGPSRVRPASASPSPAEPVAVAAAPRGCRARRARSPAEPRASSAPARFATTLRKERGESGVTVSCRRSPALDSIHRAHRRSGGAHEINGAPRAPRQRARCGRARA